MTRWDSFSEREREQIERALKLVLMFVEPPPEVEQLYEELRVVRLNWVASYGLGGRV